MRKLAMVALAVMCLGGTASVSAAQGGGGMGGGRGRGSQIDRVLQQPTAITLTADQQKKVDSLKAAMTDEQSKAREAAGDDRQAMMAAMAPITKKYMDAVRALLTADQQKTWDENVAAQPQRGRRGGGGGGGI
jgi:Spy/CpxP family protein refolding chaperone